MKNLNTRITAILLLVALCAVMIVPAMAAAPTGHTCADGTVVSTGILGSAGAPRYQSIYSQVVNGSTSYTAAFACAAENGPDMRFTITNTGSTTIYVAVYRNGSYISGGDYTVAPGETRYTTANKPTGLDGTFKFILTTDSPSGMNCTMSAVQGTNV